MNATRPDADAITPAPPADVSRREVAVRFGAGGLAALLLAAWQRPSLRAAQDASPTGPVGVTGELLGVGQPTTTPGMELSLRRITFAPGGLLPPHSHPGALIVYVESGTWGHTALGGTAQLMRATAGGTPVAAEEVEIGTEMILTAGDALYVEDPQDDVRNAGEDDVVVWVAGLTRIGEPFTTLMDDMGTPAP